MQIIAKSQAHGQNRDCFPGKHTITILSKEMRAMCTRYVHTRQRFEWLSTAVVAGEAREITIISQSPIKVLSQFLSLSGGFPF